MPTSPRRRWFQFGLRTMFVVVTVFALWLGWELKFIHDRQEAIRELRKDKSMLIMTKSEWEGPPGPGQASSKNPFPVRIPFWREWLGDEAYGGIHIIDGDVPGLVDKLVRLFPETTLAVHYKRSVANEFGDFDDHEIIEPTAK